MDQEKLQAWFDGDIDDDELSKIEIAWLSSSVAAAVSKIVLARHGVHTFAEHRTIQ
jgi:hypothetical protein